MSKSMSMNMNMNNIFLYALAKCFLLCVRLLILCMYCIYLLQLFYCIALFLIITAYNINTSIIQILSARQFLILGTINKQNNEGKLIQLYIKKNSLYLYLCQSLIVKICRNVQKLEANYRDAKNFYQFILNQKGTVVLFMSSTYSASQWGDKINGYMNIFIKSFKDVNEQPRIQIFVKNVKDWFVNAQEDWRKSGQQRNGILFAHWLMIGLTIINKLVEKLKDLIAEQRRNLEEERQQLAMKKKRQIQQKIQIERKKRREIQEKQIQEKQRLQREKEEKERIQVQKKILEVIRFKQNQKQIQRQIQRERSRQKLTDQRRIMQNVINSKQYFDLKANQSKIKKQEQTKNQSQNQNQIIIIKQTLNPLTHVDSVIFESYKTWHKEEMERKDGQIKKLQLENNELKKKIIPQSEKMKELTLDINEEIIRRQSLQNYCQQLRKQIDTLKKSRF